MDADTFRVIARHIDEQWRAASSGQPGSSSSEQSQARDKIWDMAMLACLCLKDNAGSLHNAELYQELKGLTFVPATKVCCCQLKGRCFQGHGLAWTLCNRIGCG